MKIVVATAAVLALAMLPGCSEKPPAEVTIASTPAGATVSLDGAELGKTPYTLKVKQSTKVTIAAPGHAPQELTVEPDGAPNLVVKLEATAPQPAPAPAPAPTPTATAEKKASPYPNIAKLKAAFKAGRIDRDKYDQIGRQLKKKRDERIGRLKKIYKDGKIDRGEYDRRKRVIVNKYEGE